MLKKMAVLCAGFAGFLLLARGVAWYGPYSYDEADYMYALSMGSPANAFDSPSMSLVDFVKTGLHHGGASGERSDLASEIRSSNDVLFYRHFHGPLYGYWLALSQRFTTDERATRKLNYLFAAGSALLLYFGALWLIEGSAGQIAAILALFLYLWSYPVVKTSELGPHQLFSLLTIVVLLMLAAMMQERRPIRGYWYAAVFASALTCCTLEVGFVPVFTTLVCGWIARKALHLDLSLALRSVALFLATVAVVWPAALMKLSFIKSYLFMAYLAFFRTWSNTGFSAMWAGRFLSAPILWILLAIGAIYCFRSWRSKTLAPVFLPFAVFTASMILATLKVTTDIPRYWLILLPGMVLLGAFAAGFMLAHRAAATRNATVALIAIGMFTSSWFFLRTQPADPVPPVAKIVALLKEQPGWSASAVNHSVLVPYEHLPTLHYYFPGVRFRAYYDEKGLATDLHENDIAGVIFRGNPPRLQALPLIASAGTGPGSVPAK